MTDPLDTEIRQMFGRLAEAAPPAPDLEDPRAVQRPDRHRALTLAAAGVIVVGGVTGIVTVMALDRTERTPTATPSPTHLVDVEPSPTHLVDVEYERLEYRAESELTCAQPLVSSSLVTSSVIEVWADREGERWRNRISYPDGGTRDVLATGDAFYSEELAERGQAPGQSPGCLVDGQEVLLLVEPAQGDFFSLNPVDDVPWLGGEPMVYSYRELGTRVDGEFRDSRGRLASLWREEVTGRIDVGAEEQPVTQTTEWYVDVDGNVLEQRYTNSIHTVGTATATLTVVDADELSVEESVFDNAGYRSLPGTPDPRTNGSGSIPGAGCPTVEPQRSACESGITVAPSIPG
jgi:hypothetical protein